MVFGFESEMGVNQKKYINFILSFMMHKKVFCCFLDYVFMNGAYDDMQMDF
jgi:hypothetical protein